MQMLVEKLLLLFSTIVRPYNTFTGYSVTFRPRSTSVAGTISNAEGFACCCRAANDEDGYRVGTGQGFKLATVGIGHLGWSATADNLP